ncbi:MAG TPA: conjugal transfer protein [Solirubrobacterales bacterium]|nr:conjugal transfer protein [Solirubrobacterales bacterium]
MTEAIRPLGRMALWAALAVLLIRGAAAIFSAPASKSAEVEPQVGASPGRAAEVVAVGFARTFLESPAPEALAPFLAEGAHVSAGEGAPRPGLVDQAEVVRVARLGEQRWVLTVSCDLRDSRVLDVAVPIVREGAGEVAALGAPSIVAVPATAGVDPERPRPTAGADASAIDELVAKFLPDYLAAGSSRELAYFLAPEAAVVPLGGEVEAVSIGQPEQLGEGEGPRRDLLVGARLKDPAAAGVVYPAAYRLQVVRRAGRWYVATVEGAVS